MAKECVEELCPVCIVEYNGSEKLVDEAHCYVVGGFSLTLCEDHQASGDFSTFMKARKRLADEHLYCPCMTETSNVLN